MKIRRRIYLTAVSDAPGRKHRYVTRPVGPQGIDDLRDKAQR